MKTSEAHTRAKSRLAIEARQRGVLQDFEARMASAEAMARRASPAVVRWRCYEGGPGSTVHLDTPHGRHRHSAWAWVQQGLVWNRVTRRVAAWHLVNLRAWKKI